MDPTSRPVKGGGGRTRFVARTAGPIRKSLLKIGEWVPTWIRPFAEVFAAIVGLIGIIDWLLGLAHVIGIGYSVILGMVIFAVLVTALATGLSYKQKLEALKDTEAGPQWVSLDAAEVIHDMHHALRYCAYAVHHRDAKAAAKAELGHALTAAAILFRSAVGVECRVCIKELTYDGDPSDIPDWNDEKVIKNLYVRTTLRNGNPPPSDSDKPLRVSDCTAFEELWRGRSGRWFVVQDIEQEFRDGTYKNPTRTQGQKDPPYNSSMVWPIQLDQNRFQTEGTRHVTIFGYLCVDTKAVNVFTDTHGWLGAALADACFTTLHRPSVHPREHAARMERRRRKESQ
jgi:hypothetical protein